jgi:uncharacterized protein (DUF58 family)
MTGDPGQPSPRTPATGPGSREAEIHRRRREAEGLAARLPPLLVAAPRVAATVVQGIHGRRQAGPGETFWQFRRYQPGDRIGAIDWRQSARTQAVFVRETEWAAAQSVWLWHDRSPSMNWRSTASLPTKRARGEALTLALAAALLRGGERVALLGAGIGPAIGRPVLGRLAAAMTGDGLPTEGVPRPERLSRHARLVVIGDLLSPLDEIDAALAGAAGRGVRGHLLQIMDPAEETLPFTGRVRFSGLEREGEMLVPRVQALRPAYADALASHRAGLKALARRHGWSLATHRTDQPPGTALLALHAALAGAPAGERL